MLRKKNKIPSDKIIGPRHQIFDTSSEDQIKSIASICKAISSVERINILKLISLASLSIVEISQKLNLAVSSTAFHVKKLEEAGVIVTDSQSGARGAMRLCGHSLEKLEIILVSENIIANSSTYSISMPIGHFYNFNIAPTCGMANKDGLLLGIFDNQNDFYDPKRVQAQMIWFGRGFLEYRFAKYNIKNIDIRNISFSCEICSEAPGYRSEWPSDISIIVNEKEIGVYNSPGDYGERHGLITPESWSEGSTQYGILKTFSVNNKGSFIDGQLSSNIKLEDLKINEHPYISFIIAVKEDAKHVGGVNIFGKEFGDHPQDIVMNIFY